MYPSSGEQFREIENVKEAFTIAHQTSRFDGKADCDRRWMQSKLHSDGAGGWPTSPERATDRHKRVHSRPVPRACQQEPQFAILTTSPLAQTPRWWKLSSNSGQYQYLAILRLGIMPCFLAASDNGCGT
jgi:hypothetical protein